MDLVAPDSGRGVGVVLIRGCDGALDTLCASSDGGQVKATQQEKEEAPSADWLRGPRRTTERAKRRKPLGRLRARWAGEEHWMEGKKPGKGRRGLS